jgi:hypothetical protein
MSAADKLGMSLDAIIATAGSGKKKSFNKPNSSGNRKQNSNSNSRGPNQKPHVFKSSNFHDDRVGGKFNPNKNDNVERPLKVITIERPKVIQPGQHHQQQQQSGAHQAQTSSVFNRLGKAGSTVIFRNLKRSVQQNDVIDLCRVVGDIKEVQLSQHGNVNTARALFSNERDAAACVAKYHGTRIVAAFLKFIFS